MGGMRVTQGMLTQRVLNNLQSQLRRLAVFQERLATGRRVNRPSDDPIDARRAINVRNLIGQNEQFLSNISDVGPQLNESEIALLGVVSIIQRAQELTIQGASGTNGQAQLDQIALEIDQLLEATVVAGNHLTNGRFVFAGSRTLTDPFVATRNGAGDIVSVAYVGNDVLIEAGVSEGSRVVVNEPGSAAFQDVVDIFDMLIGIRDDLRAGNQGNLQTTRLTELDGALDQVLLSTARLGSIQNRLNRVAANTEDLVLGLQELLSDKVDADFAETMVHLNSESNALQAALNSAARIIQPSLLDFLR